MHAFMYVAKVAAARVCQWATAGPVLIKGATGLNADIINGGFEVAERPDDEPPIYQRVDGSDGWLFVNPRVNKWMVGEQQDKDARTTSSRGRAQSVAEAVGRLPHEVGSAWQVLDRRDPEICSKIFRCRPERNTSKWTVQRTN